MKLKITDFDTKRGEFEGMWEGRFRLFGSSVESGFVFSLADSEKVGIYVEKERITICDYPNAIRMHNNVVITPDSVLASGVASGVSVFSTCQMTREKY